MASATASVLTPNPTSPAWSIYVDNQVINFTIMYGGIDSVPLYLIDGSTHQFLSQMGIFGANAGATGVTLIVMFIFTDRKKFRTPLFLVNSLSVFFQLLV